ncbi:MAG: hypothetical protein ACRD36_10185, partial [Candidatus Acidiferrum sp.]
MFVITNPFFWASISLLGLVLAAGVVGSDTLRRSASLGLFSVAVFALGRVILVLPFSVQPRLNLGAWHWAVAAMLF